MNSMHYGFEDFSVIDMKRQSLFELFLFLSAKSIFNTLTYLTIFSDLNMSNIEALEILKTNESDGKVLV